jgi:hypothetical protein
VAVTAQGSGTQAATTTTEHTLLDVAVAGTFQFITDKFTMAASDVLELRVYQIVLTAGARRVAYFQSYAGAQSADDMIAICVPISNELTDAGSLRFTLKWTGASGPKNFPWKVLKFA